MLAELARSQRRGEAIVICAWRPHWMNIVHDIRYLADPLKHWGGEGRARVYTLAREGLPEDQPSVTAFLKSFQIPSSTQSEWINAYAREGRDPESIARDWVDDNPDLITPWINAARQ